MSGDHEKPEDYNPYDGIDPSVDRLLDGCTTRQRNWAYEFLIDWNATQAAIRAGYGENKAALLGHRNLHLPKMQAFLRAEQERRAKHSIINQQFMVDRWLAMADDPDVSDAVRARALENLGKYRAPIPERFEFSGPDGGDIPVSIGHAAMREWLADRELRKQMLDATDDTDTDANA